MHRPWFETRLRALHNASSSEDDNEDEGDPGWYALRNTIYAAGCRIEMSKHSTLRDCNQVAWGYFENALSVHTEVLYFRTSMVGIQALTLMVRGDTEFDVEAMLTKCRLTFAKTSQVRASNICCARVLYAWRIQKVSTDNRRLLPS